MEDKASSVESDPPRIEKKHPIIGIGLVSPIGVKQLPDLDAQMVGTYFDNASADVAKILAVGGLGTVLIPEALKSKISRRRFLQGIGLGAAGVALPGVIPSAREAVAEYLRRLDQRAFGLFTDHELLRQYWLREKYGYKFYDLRGPENKLSLEKVKQETYTDPIFGDVGKLHHYKYLITEEPKLSPVMKAAEKYLKATGGINKSFIVYEISKGHLLPVVHPEDGVISARADEIHRLNNTPMVVQFNATAPQGLGMSRTIEVCDKSQIGNNPYLLPVVYGSSSLFIPEGIQESSPIWKHAADRLKMKNPYFEELNFRENDPSHNAIGFTQDGNISMVSQEQLKQIVKDKKLPDSLRAVALNQFCFDPRKNRGIPPEFSWTANIHRNVNMLLVTQDGRQMIASGSLDMFLKNSDYLSIIRDLEKDLNVTFVMAACLDVGLAVGVTLRKDNDNNLVKPVEPKFHDRNGNLNLGLIHTSSIFLNQQV